MNRFELRPSVGAGDLTFTLNQEQARYLLGPPHKSYRNWQGKVGDVWNGVAVSYSPADGMIDEIVLSSPSIALFGGRDLLSCDDAVELVQRIDPNPKAWMGSVVFLEARMSLKGLLHPEDARAVALGRQGHWTEYANRMTALDSEGTN